MSNTIDLDDIKEPVQSTETIGCFKSTVNLVLTAVGVGVLALPLAIAQSGWAMGVLLLLVTWALSQFMMHLLWKCIMTERRRGVVVMDSYGSVGEAALGKPGRYLVSVATYIGLSAICVIILILLGGGLFSITGTLTRHAWIRIAALCILPLSWLPSLKEIGVLSAVGVVGVCLVGIVVLAASISLSDADRGDISPMPASPSGLAMSFIEFMNSFTVAPVIPTIIAGMKTPAKFPKVSAYAFAIISLCFAVIGFAGYAGWGDQLLESDGNIISVISGTANGAVYKTICEVSIIVVSLSHFLVMFNPVALLSDSVVDLVPVQSSSLIIALRMAGRSCVVGILLSLALFIPSFGTIVNLVGSTVVMPLQVLFPICFYLILCKEEILTFSQTRKFFTYSLFAAATGIALIAMCYGLFDVIIHWKL